MIIFTDIDETVAGGFPYKQYYNDGCGLQMTADELETIHSYQDLYQHPKFQQHIKLHGRALYDSLFVRVRQHLPSMAARTPLPYAQERLHALAKHGMIKYVSIRKSQDTATQSLMKSVTVNWLGQHHFPCPDNVSLVRTFHRKVALTLQESQEELLLFIDDKWDLWLKAYADLKAQLPRHTPLQQLPARMTLLAFGVNEIPQVDTQGFKVIAVPSWQHVVDRFIVQIDMA